MPVCLQIFIGSLPLLIVAAVTLLRKKAFVLPGIMVALVLVAVIFGLVRFDLGQTDSEAVESVTSVTRDQLLCLAQHATSEENCDLAEELLDELYQSFGDDAEAALQEARLRVLDGDTAAAFVLYQKACALDKDLSVMDEEAAYFALVETGSLYGTFEAAVAEAEIEYLTAQGLDAADYGYTCTAAELQSQADSLTEFQAYVSEISGQDADASNYDDSARTAAEKILAAAETLDEAVSAYRKSGTYTSEDADVMEDALGTVEKYLSDAPEMAGISWLDQAIVGGYQLTGDKKALISYAKTTGSDTAYAAIADLYIQGEVSKKLLNENFSGLTSEEYDALTAECEKTAEKISYGTSQEQTDVEDMIEALQERVSDLALSELETRIRPENYAIEEKSKLYVIKSMVNYVLNNDSKGGEYLAEALSTAPYSGDAEYADAMRAISGVLNGTTDSNDIKNVSSYLAEAYALAFPAWVEYVDGEPAGFYDTSGSGGDSADSSASDSTSLTVAASLSMVSTTSSVEDDESGGTGLTGGISTNFLNGATSYVSTAKAMINISSVDASDFPEVTFRLQSTREISLTNPSLLLWDCNLSIDSYTITEVPYDGARVALVCDTSGSMSGSESSLREAVQKYIEDMNEDEQVSIVAFAGDVKFTSGFSGDPSYFSDYISKLDANGGTNISSGVWSAIESMQSGENVYRAVIVLTDGEDSSFSADSLATLNATCEEYGITVYTIGLGSSIQAEYLESLAAAGNGQFVYCSDISQLESLYAFIHSQMQNSYEITYTAVNTDWSDRTVAAQNTEDGGYAEKAYTIEATETEEDGAKITSVDTRSIYKKEASATFHLLGENFAADTAISVTISGDMGRYVLEASYQNETQITVTIPVEVPIGTYTLTATADQSVYEDEIEIFCEYQELVFGAYVFRAQKITVTEENAVLTGDVTLNDYLHFNGTIILTGNVEEDLSVTLLDDGGSYVNATEKLPGIFSSAYSNTLSLPAFGLVTIFNDQAHLTDLNEYKVEAFSYSSLSWAGIIYEFNTASLYPHMVSFLAAELNFSLPFQKDIMKYNELSTPFTAEVSLSVLVVPAGLRAAGKISTEVSRDFKFLTLPFYLKKFKLEFDTFKHDYSLEMAVSTNKLIPSIGKKNPEDADYGFSVKMKGGLFDEFHLIADAKIVLSEAPMLVTLSDFQVGFTGMAAASTEAGQDASFAKVLAKTTWEGGCDISFWKIKDLIPAAEAIFKDKSLFSLDDTTISLRISNFKLGLETTAKLLGFEVGSAEGTLGNYTYSNYLLGISSEDMTGLYVSLTAGPDISLGNLEFSAQGNLVLALVSDYTNASLNGTIDYDITFIRHFANTLDGDLVLSTHRYREQITVIVKGRDLKKNKEAGVKLTISGLWAIRTFY